MDHFGIGQAIHSMVRMYTYSARQSGRTISLVESLKNGDRVVFLNPKEADRVKRLCLERDVTIACIVVDPQRLDRLMDAPQSEGRTIFDHSWVEQYYLGAVERCQKELDHFQTETSGYGAAHRATRRAAEEMARWRF